MRVQGLLGLVVVWLPLFGAAAGSREIVSPRVFLCSDAELNMGARVSRHSGCFGVTSTVIVRLVDGSRRQVEVRAVKAGDQVEVEGGGWAKVLCVVRMATPATEGLVSIPGGPTLTAHHPVRVGGVWRAPEGLGPLVSSGGVVYNFVLDASHVLLVDGYPCVTFGHGLSEEGVVHAFYGTGAVIDALRALPGWSEGYVGTLDTVRNADGHAVGFTLTSTSDAIGTQRVLGARGKGTNGVHRMRALSWNSQWRLAVGVTVRCVLCATHSSCCVTGKAVPAHAVARRPTVCHPEDA